MTQPQISQGAIAAVLEARLLTFLGGGDIVVESSPIYVPQAGKPYLSGQILSYQRYPLGVGSPVAQAIEGTYRIAVNRPVGEGMGPARGVAARLVHLFERGIAGLVLVTGQTLSILSATENPAIAMGDWLSVPVVVTFICTE